jgi:hypothetical protein
MDRISIFNYEAFYLDFLEGNLGEEDAALLMAFLEEHPELKVEDELLPEFNLDEVQLEPTFKEGLKQIDFNSTLINSANAEHFLIAEVEGLLSDQKVEELEQLVFTDRSLGLSRKIFAVTRLKPDYSIKFNDKEGLKQTRKIILWPYISLAAAASIALFFFLGDPNEPLMQPMGLAKMGTEQHVFDAIGSRKMGNGQSKTEAPSDQIVLPLNLLNNGTSEPQVTVASVVPTAEKREVGQLKIKKVKYFKTAPKVSEPIENTPR